jgi:hypothetical protein
MASAQPADVRATMIISHELKLIFIKTKKVAGTSFEIALSKFCGKDCVITPILPADEATRAALGYRGAQNYAWRTWNPFGVKEFYNHIPAAQVKRMIPADIWRDYRKLAIFRNPFDAIISRYYWAGGKDSGSPFDQFVRRNPKYLRENTVIAPLKGDARLDRYLRYERLEQELGEIGLGHVWEEFARIKAKGDRRPTAGASVSEVYRDNPELVAFIAAHCAEELAFFDYEIPEPSAP